MNKNVTDKKSLFCVQIILLIMLLVGCGTPDPAGTAETTGQLPTQIHQPTTQNTEVEDSEHRPGKEEGFVHSYALGTVVSYDLDGDGTAEDITVNAQEYSDGQLTISGTSVNYMAINPTGYFTVLNLDQSVNTLLVGISDYGFSDDDMTVLYAYDGGKITEAGAFEDILGTNSYGRTGAVCHGDGTITARVRMDVLGTWTALGLYRMGETGLEDHTDLYWRMDWEDRVAGWEVTVKMDLPMFTENNQTSDQLVVSAGTAMRMTAVRKGQEDYTHWACFEVDSFGRTLWVLTEEIDWQTYVQTNDGLIDSEAVFEGFFYAG